MPHILRDVAHERIKRVFSGHSAVHAFFLNVHGDLFALGRNEHGQLGLPITPNDDVGGKAVFMATRLDRDIHFVPAAPHTSDGDVVDVSCGRNHTLLCTRDGKVYAAGLNTNGQCGHPKTQGDVELFHRIEVAPFVKDKDPVVKVAAGITFSLALTASGKLYAMGSTEKGQLGNGRTGEHFVTSNKLAFNTHTEPILVRALSDKKIVEISCGQQHSIAMDEDGYCYAWGFGGYGRLGLGSSDDQLSPVLIPQFARDNVLTRARHVLAGPTCSVVIDRQRLYWLTGKWKMTGDGGSGQGFINFKFLPDLQGCKMQRAALGGVALLAIADEDPTLRGDHQATMNVAWGQNASYGELGLGWDAPRSATKPLRCEPLDGLSILDVAAGLGTTFYITRNLGDAYAELPSHPPAQQSQETCLICNKGEDEDDTSNALLECERCEEPWHIQCLDPPLDAIPDGEWHCPQCLGLVLDHSSAKTGSTKSSNGASANNKKRSAPQNEAETDTKKKTKASK